MLGVRSALTSATGNPSRRARSKLAGPVVLVDKAVVETIFHDYILPMLASRGVNGSTGALLH